MKRVTIGDGFDVLALGNRFIVATGEGDYPLDYDDVEILHEKTAQWLKENPKKVEGWMNIYGGTVNANYEYPTHKEADEHASMGRIACIPISYHIGEGLETTEDQSNDCRGDNNESRARRFGCAVFEYAEKEDLS